MKTKPIVILIVAACLPLAAVSVRAEDPPQDQPAAEAPSPVQLDFTITLGGQIRDVTNAKSSKFQLGRDVREGFILRNFFFDAQRPGRPWYFQLSGEEAGERDQRFRLLFERFGRSRTEVRWHQFSSFSADNIQTLHTGAGEGVLVVPDLIQTQFQAASSTALPGLVQGVLAATPFGRLRLLRRRLDLDQEFIPTRHWRLRFGLRNELLSGDRRISVGAYARTNMPLGDTFFNPSIEAPEPVDYRTTEVTAGASYEGDRGFFRADYRASLFRNRTSTLTMDNPFRISDAVGSRFRFARTQVDLYPDNDTHTISFLGGYSFQPWNTRLAGALNISLREQNDPFLPFTLNTAIVATNLPAGVPLTDPGTLPQSSLNGEATVVSSDVAVTTHPAETVRVAVRYNSYDWEDNSDEILFPGYANADSRWLLTHGTDRNGVDLPIANRLHSFLRQRSGATVIWKPRKFFSWKNQFGWEGWNRENRELGRLNEWLWKSQIILKSKKWFYAKLNYGYGDRVPHGIYDTRKEFELLRKFDQAHRIRHNADLLFQITPEEQFILSGSYGYRSNRYDEQLYGLATYVQGFFTVDANYVPNDRFAGTINFTRERYRSTANEVSKTGAVDFNLPNTFVRDINDRVNSLGLGFSTNFLDHRLNWDVSYAFALSQVRIETSNPFTVDLAATLNATAFPFPDIEENFHEVRTTLSYRMRDNVELGVRYLLEPRALHDFTWDILSPYIDGREAPENDLIRSIYLDARDSSYHGHAAAIFLRYTF